MQTLYPTASSYSSLRNMLKRNLLLSYFFSLIIRMLGSFEKLSMIPYTLSSLTLTFEDQLNKLSESVTVSRNE